MIQRNLKALSPGFYPDTYPDVQPSSRPRPIVVAVVSVLLLMATLHCALSVFWLNYSYVDLRLYIAGTAPMPYQGRIGMMPILQAAQNSPRFVDLAKKVDDNRHLRHKRFPFEPISALKLASLIAGTVALLLTTALALFYGLKRFPNFWWLPPTLMLAMLYITEAARYEVTLWYPWDLPHAFLFGAACLLIFEGLWIPVFLVFLIDLPVRETAIFLMPLSFGVAWVRGQHRQAIAVSIAMLGVWIPFRIWILHRYAANLSTEMGLHLGENLHNVVNPSHWPQMLSAFGFLLIPLIMGNRLLKPSQRAFMLAAVPCLIVTSGYGVWAETRIFGEWLLPAAVLATAEIDRLFITRRSATLDLPLAEASRVA